MSSMPSMPIVQAGIAAALYSVLASDWYRISLISVDLPDPLTPVTAVNTPSGIVTSTFFRLLARAPRTTISPFSALRRDAGF